MAGEQPGRKKRGRPRKMQNGESPGGASTARTSQTAAVRRSGRQRRPRRARDFADYGDEDDDFYWWELSSDEDAVKKKGEDDLMANDDAEPRKFRLLRKLPSQSDGSGCSGREEEDEIGGRDCAQECNEPASASTPLPDKKTLDSVLDKLQKKDIYGVYAEPVDPDELPDYHDIIKHPMDFQTIRKKLADGCYTDLEKFESDVFLLCTNAMQYNAPDTIYFRQAHSIQELARKKFQNLRLTRKELTKSEGNNVTARHADMVPSSNGDTINDVTTFLATVPQQPAGDSGNMEGSLINDDKSLKMEDNSVKNPSKLEGKSEALYEDRRSTYNTPVDLSSFSLFDHDKRHLVPVGLEGTQYSYAKSLAHFAGPLGPAIWKIASRRIKQSLPPEVSFGPGWVGDYEPLPQSPYLLDMSEKRREGIFMGDVGPRLPGRPLTMADGLGPRWLRKSTSSAPRVDQMNTCGMGVGDRGQPERFGQIPVSQLTDARFGQIFAEIGNPRSSIDFGQTGQVDQKIGQILPGSSARAPTNDRFGRTHLDTKTLADGRSGQTPADVSVGQNFTRFSQNPSGNVNPVSHFDPRVFADGRFGQNPGGNVNAVSNSDPRVFSDGRFGQNPGGNVNAVSNLDPRVFSDGKFSQTLAARLNPAPHSGIFPGQRRMSLEQSTGRSVNLTKSTTLAENPNLLMRSSTIDAVTTAAPTRMSIGRPPPPSPRTESNFSHMGQRVSESTGEEEQWAQNKNLPGFTQVNHSVFPRQACWQGLTPHWQEEKNESRAPDLNVDFQSPRLPDQQTPGICADPPQPDLALQL